MIAGLLISYKEIGQWNESTAVTISPDMAMEPLLREGGMGWIGFTSYG